MREEYVLLGISSKQEIELTDPLKADITVSRESRMRCSTYSHSYCLIMSVVDQGTMIGVAWQALYMIGQFVVSRPSIALGFRN